MSAYDKRQKLARVTITLPAQLAKRADAEARRLDRSRSWVVAEALRRYLHEIVPHRSTPRVAEPAAPAYPASPGLGPQRLAQLEADMRLTPEQRVHEAEETFETALRARPQPRLEQVLLFETLEDYYAWKKRDLLW